MKGWENQTRTAGGDSRRKQQYKEMSKGCDMYDPCPINYQCMNKATHLYAKCVNCEVPHAAHNHKVRSFMIRRENFAITVTKETGEKLVALCEAQEEK